MTAARSLVTCTVASPVAGSKVAICPPACWTAAFAAARVVLDANRTYSTLVVVVVGAGVCTMRRMVGYVTTERAGAIDGPLMTSAPVFGS